MSNDNALHRAAERGNLDLVQSHVRNFDINAKGEYDQTALLKAALNGEADVVKLLLTFNPDVNIPDVSTLKYLSVYIYFIPISLFLHLSVTSLSTCLYHHLPTTHDTQVTSCCCFIKFSLHCLNSHVPCLSISWTLSHTLTYTHYPHVCLILPIIALHMIYLISTISSAVAINVDATPYSNEFLSLSACLVSIKVCTTKSHSRTFPPRHYY